MFVSVIVAARNEGESLWKTVRSCSDGAPGLGFEVIVADDHSDDGSIEELQRRFPRVRVVRHADPTDQRSEAIGDGDSSPPLDAPGFELGGSEATPSRRGAAATKDLGARHARGEILIFLDGHCHVDSDSLRRLIDDTRAG